MLFYQCKFLLNNGKKVEAIIPVQDAISLTDKTLEYDGILISAKKIPPRAFKLSTSDFVFLFSYIKEFINANLPVIEAIETIQEETRKLNIRAVVAKLKYDINAGYFLSDAMRNQRNIFSEMSISLIAAGERINELASACEHIIYYIQFARDLKQKVKSAIMYPIFMFAVIFGITVFYSKFVIPKLETVFTEFASASAVPLQTKLLVGFASFVASYWVMILVYIITMPIITIIAYKKSYKVKFMIDTILLYTPFFGPIVIRFQLVRFSIFVTNMYDKGYNFLDSVNNAIIVVTNSKMKQDFEDMINDIKGGENVYKTFRRISYIPRFTQRMFRVAEVTGNITAPLQSIHNFYVKDIDNRLEKALRYIKPISILLIGGLMIWIISATLLPFYTKIPQLLNSVGV